MRDSSAVASHAGFILEQLVALVDIGKLEAGL
jgi:hypothetical protein